MLFAGVLMSTGSNPLAAVMMQRCQFRPCRVIINIRNNFSRLTHVVRVLVDDFDFFFPAVDAFCCAFHGGSLSLPVGCEMVPVSDRRVTFQQGKILSYRSIFRSSRNPYLAMTYGLLLSWRDNADIGEYADQMCIY